VPGTGFAVGVDEVDMLFLIWIIEVQKNEGISGAHHTLSGIELTLSNERDTLRSLMGEVV
jgi:hypothetical protein